MKIDKIVVGELQTNCYILSIDNKCLVIDPGDEYDKIRNAIGEKEIVGVIITHYHFDHIGALDYFNNSLILDRNNLKEKEYNINDFNFEVIYTPGHKEDCISLYFKECNCMFTGDFLFKNTIGRTDLEGGNIEAMDDSLDKIKNFNHNIKIYPGHGDSTTLKNELINNPYFDK